MFDSTEEENNGILASLDGVGETLVAVCAPAKAQGRVSFFPGRYGGYG